MADIGSVPYPTANPNALLDTAQGYVGLANSALANRQGQQNLVLQQVDYLNQGLSSLLSKPDLSAQDFLNFGQQALKDGIISPQTYQVEAAQVQATGGDPTKLRALAQSHMLRSLDAGQRYGAQTGMMPGSQSDVVTYTTPTGATATTTRGNFVGAVGNGTGNSLITNPSAPNNMLTGVTAPAGAVPSTPHPMGTAPAAPAPAVASVPGGAGGIAGPSPQQTAQYQASAKQQQDDLTADAGYTSNLVPLTKTLKLLPNTTIGLGSEIPNDVAKVFSTFGLNFGSDQAQNASEVEKYLTQLVRSSGAAANSDNQLTAAFSANPNMTTDKAAATDVLKTMLSLTRMQHAKVAAAQAAGVAPEQYSKWASQWGAAQDPRAFGVDLMTPQAKAALLTELNKNPAEKAKFLQSLQIADSLGVLDNSVPPNG